MIDENPIGTSCLKRAVIGIAVLTVLIGLLSKVPDSMWRAVREDVLSDGKQPTPPKPAPPPKPKPLPPQPAAPRDLPQPYPELSASGDGREYASGPASRSHNGALADHSRKVVHAMRWPEGDLVALNPQTGETVYAHAAGAAPLAVIGNRLLAQGETSLWLLDTQDGAALFELPLPMLPPLLDPSYRKSLVEVRERAGDVLVVSIHRVSGGAMDPERADQRWEFGLDVAAAKVVACPPKNARERVGYDFKIDGMVFDASNGRASPAEGPERGQVRWKVWLRRLYAPKPVLPSPPALLPKPWPTARATGEGQPLKPGPGYHRVSRGGLADPARGVYHLTRDAQQDLVAVEPLTGEVVYTHKAGDEPIVVWGNRLLARSEGRLWILDTHDGTPVFELELPALPPLLNDPQRVYSSVDCVWGSGSVLRVTLFQNVAPEPEPGAVERKGWTSTRHVFGLDLATGEVVDPPERASHEPPYPKGEKVGELMLNFHNQLASGRNLGRDWRKPLWEITTRSLQVEVPLEVEAPDPPR